MKKRPFISRLGSQISSNVEKNLYLILLLITLTASSVEQVLSQEMDPKPKALIEENIENPKDGTLVLEMKNTGENKKEEFLENQTFVLEPSFLENAVRTVQVLTNGEGSPIPNNQGSSNEDLTQPIFCEEEDETHPEELGRKVEKLKNTLKGFFPGLFPKKSRQQIKSRRTSNGKKEQS